MSAWLRLLLGLDEGEIPAGGVSRLELAGVPGGWWALAALGILVAAVVLVVLIYRRETDLALWKRICLGSLRLVALGAVVLVLLNPRLLVELQARRPAETLLLVDGSGSMGMLDRYAPAERDALRRGVGIDVGGRDERTGEGKYSRADLIALALEKSELAARLDRVNRVRCFQFDEGIAPQERADLPAALRAAPASGKGTWIGSALRAALETARTAPVAGVVLISDGRSSGGDPLAGAAAELEARGIPLHALGVGKLDVSKNIVLSELNAPEVAETGLPIRLRVRVRASGYPGEAEVKVTRIRQGEKSAELVGNEVVSLREFASESVVNVTDVPPRDGRYRYRAEVAPRAGEESQRDNFRTVEVVVASEKCRVLLISGGPSYEFRYLRNFFIRDAGIQVSSWLSSADREFPQEGDLPLRTLPADPEALKIYDVVVLLDPDPEALPEGFTAALERMVSEFGAGLCFVAGEHYTKTLSRSREGQRLLGLLPVELGGRDPGHDHRRPWRVELTAAGRSHTLCQLKARPDENLQVWSLLPRFYFRFPVGALKPSAIALWSAGEAAAAAVHQPGAGRVLFLATDDLYRWREYREEIHEQFWSGAARFLALGKRLAGTRQVSVNTDRERYLTGEEVRIEAHVSDAEHRPLVAPRVAAVVERQEEEPSGPSSSIEGGGNGDGEGSLAPASASDGSRSGARQEVQLEAVPSRPGWFRGRIKAVSAGSFRVNLDGGAEGTPAAYRVAAPSGELDDPSPDFAALKELAGRTGGKFGTLADVARVPEWIPDRTVVEVLGRKTVTLWDSAALLLVFAGALIVEWSLRKKWRLC